VEDAAKRMQEHTHRWSGGMLQRALVAMALMTTPQLVIADEPTSALDPTSRQAVVDLFRERAGTGTGFLVFTHDSALIAALQARVVYGAASLSAPG
jgi:ABC-type dipeptide/oligopeptide/nickel transport system ATPase component